MTLHTRDTTALLELPSVNYSGGKWKCVTYQCCSHLLPSTKAIIMSWFRLPPICSLDWSSSGMSYWFSKQLDMNLEEVALIAHTVTMFCSQLTTGSSQAAREEKPSFGLCTLLHSQVLISFSKSSVNSIKSSSSDSNTQFYNCLRAQKTHPGSEDAVRPMEFCPPHSLLSQERFPVHPRPPDTPWNIWKWQM